MSKLSTVNSQLSIKDGFTLIELLVALVIFVVLAFFATQSLANILQTRTKAEATRAVRQEADYVISVMERRLREATSVTCVSPTQINYVDPDGVSSSFSCISSGGQDSYIASGSARLTTRDIAVSSCVLTCSGGSQVGINLGIRQSSSTTDPRETSSISVSSQVILRNQ